MTNCTTHCSKMSQTYPVLNGNMYFIGKYLWCQQYRLKSNVILSLDVLNCLPSKHSVKYNLL
jgi:hypothetical protein